jgi:hypothetical protein
MAARRHPLRNRLLLRVRRGDFATVKEIMLVGSLPRQTVCRWLREARIDLAQMRLKQIVKMHEREERFLAGLPAKKRPSKKLLHWIAGRAKKQWDQRHATEQEGVPAAGSGDPDRRGDRA